MGISNLPAASLRQEALNEPPGRMLAPYFVRPGPGPQGKFWENAVKKTCMETSSVPAASLRQEALNEPPGRMLAPYFVRPGPRPQGKRGEVATRSPLDPMSGWALSAPCKKATQKLQAKGSGARGAFAPRAPILRRQYEPRSCPSSPPFPSSKDAPAEAKEGRVDGRVAEWGDGRRDFFD